MAVHTSAINSDDHIHPCSVIEFILKWTGRGGLITEASHGSAATGKSVLRFWKGSFDWRSNYRRGTMQRVESGIQFVGVASVSPEPQDCPLSSTSDKVQLNGT